MKNGRYLTLSELWHGECRRMLFAQHGEVHVASLTAYEFDHMIKAESMQYEFDLSKELWMTSGRFTGLQRDYIDPASLREFVEKSSRVSDKRPQMSQMQCRMKGQRHVSYKWGNCILGYTFRRLPEPRISMHSRTSMITRMGGMDLALAYCIGKEIANASGENVEDYAFTWHLGSMQHSSLQGVPYFLSHNLWTPEGKLVNPRAEQHLDKLPVLRAMVRQLDYFDRLDARGKVSMMGTRRRVREQHRAWVEGTMDRKAVPLSSLNLDKLKEDT